MIESKLKITGVFLKNYLCCFDFKNIKVLQKNLNFFQHNARLGFFKKYRFVYIVSNIYKKRRIKHGCSSWNWWIWK